MYRHLISIFGMQPAQDDPNFCYSAVDTIKYKKLTSLHYCVSVTKSHIQNSRNHLARTQSDRMTNWLPLQIM